MGVDAVIFAKKAKKYYYFDRLYNVIVFDVADDDICDRAIHTLQNKKSCTYEDAAYLINKNIEFWKTQPESDSHRAIWNEKILKFIEMCPQDTFFVTTDHEEPSYHDIAQNEGYKQYLFPEDIPEPPSCHCPKAWCPLHPTKEELLNQKEAVEALQKALSVDTALKLTDDGYLEIANLDGILKKVKYP